MNDVLGYSGRRCIVTGAASDVGAATTRILVDLGAEVHTVDVRQPDIRGIASYSDAGLRDPHAIARAVDAIGAVVNNLFNCAVLTELVDFAGMRELTQRVIPNMIDGAVITSVGAGATGEVVARYTTERSVDLVEMGIRMNYLGSSGAWPLVLLGSPRSSPLTGLTL